MTADEEEQNFLICEWVEEVNFAYMSQFRDNVRSKCSVCGHPVLYRPAPIKVIPVCRRCYVSTGLYTQGHDLAITHKTLAELIEFNRRGKEPIQ